MTNIKVTNSMVILENGDELLLDDIILDFDDCSIKGSFLLQMIRDYQNKPNWFAIHRKLKGPK